MNCPVPRRDGTRRCRGAILRRDQCVPAAPALDDRFREPRILEVGVVERDHLQRAAHLDDDLVRELVELPCVLPVSVGEFVEVTASLAVAGGRTPGWAGRAR